MKIEHQTKRIKSYTSFRLFSYQLGINERLDLSPLISNQPVVYLVLATNRRISIDILDPDWFLEIISRDDRILRKSKLCDVDTSEKTFTNLPSLY